MVLRERRNREDNKSSYCKTGRSFRFHRTEEGLPVGLYALSDGCALGLIPYGEREAFAKALPPREAERLLRMREDDNPVLVKYLF